MKENVSGCFFSEHSVHSVCYDAVADNMGLSSFV